MSEVRGVVVAHGNLADCLVETVENISGAGGLLAPISNEACSPDELGERIGRAVGDGPAIVFVDLASGSCAHAALRLQHGHGRLVVVTGVNLAMLLDYVFHADMDLADLAARLVSKAREDTVSYPAVSPE